MCIYCKTNTLHIDIITLASISLSKVFLYKIELAELAPNSVNTHLYFYLHYGLRNKLFLGIVGDCAKYSVRSLGKIETPHMKINNIAR